MRFFLLTFLVLHFAVWAAAQTTDPRRPNFLFVIVDDQSPWELSAYNPDSALQSPTIDRLAREGVTFDNAYHMGAWVGAVCTSSRHMVMSGRTLWHIPDRGGKTKNNPNAANPDLVPPGLEGNTLAAVFNRAGYDTMRTCKKGNSYDAANRQFTVVRDATKRGNTHETGSGWHGDQVIDYLTQREASGDADPFLIYFGFSHPHDPRNAPEAFLRHYGATNHHDRSQPPAESDGQPALPKNYLPEHPFPHGQPGLRDEVAVEGVWKRRDRATIRNELGRQLACSENIDRQIDRVLQRLDSMGQLENTYVIYTSDHGMAIGRHGLQGKQNLYEHTWRVPYIIRGPGIPAGTRARGNIYLLDTLASLCDWAGIEPPETNEGVSFRGVAEGKQDVIRDTLYGCYCGGTKPGMRSVRKGDWKLVQFDVLDGTVQKTQLFHLKDNPLELLPEHGDPKVIEMTGIKPMANQTNLATDPKYADKLAEMKAVLLSEMRRLNDPYRLWDQPADN
ncbi:MAG: sulfatase-like hydrolase/transferase [Planctomycetota bacterium]